MRALAALVLFVICSLPADAAALPPSYVEAERAYSRLSINDRLAFKINLTAAGYWNVSADGDFSRKFFDATALFQANDGLASTGVVDNDLLSLAYRSSSSLFQTWGFREIAHPSRGHPVWIPMGLGLAAERDQNGLTWRDPEKRVG